MMEAFEDLSLYEDVIDVCGRTDNLRFDSLDGNLLACDAMLS